MKEDERGYNWMKDGKYDNRGFKRMKQNKREQNKIGQDERGGERIEKEIRKQIFNMSMRED